MTHIVESPSGQPYRESAVSFLRAWGPTIAWCIGAAMALMLGYFDLRIADTNNAKEIEVVRVETAAAGQLRQSQLDRIEDRLQSIDEYLRENKAAPRRAKATPAK